MTCVFSVDIKTTLSGGRVGGGTDVQNVVYPRTVEIGIEMP